jgi:hypothetical protein
VRRKRQCYREFAGKIPNADLVRTDQGIGQIVSKVSQVLIGLMVQRFHQQHSSCSSATALPGLATMKQAAPGAGVMVVVTDRGIHHSDADKAV